MPETRAFASLLAALSQNGDEASFHELVQDARNREWSPSDVVELASRLAQSGDQLHPATVGLGPGVTDIASTGGPGSLSTILGPISLAVHGMAVIKLGVSGRPAGAVDSLAQIAGYATDISRTKVEAMLRHCRFVHFVAGKHYAPLDARLFAYRRRVAAVNVPALAAASLLAKKLAVGVDRIGLDVRVGPWGNVGATREVARKFCRLFCDAAMIAERKAWCFLSDFSDLPQPYVGRVESLEALALVLKGVSKGNLLRHAIEVCAMGSTVAGVGVSESLPVGLTEAFEQHLEIQGASWSAFENAVDRSASANRMNVEAQYRGVVHDVNIGHLRQTIVDAQGAVSGEEYADPLGVIVNATCGREVESGYPLAHVRVAPTLGNPQIWLDRVAAAINIGEGDPFHRQEAKMEIISV